MTPQKAEKIELIPWDKTKVAYKNVFHLDYSPEEAWSAISDFDLLSQLAGNQSQSLKSTFFRDGLQVSELEMVSMGMKSVSWELPFEWIYPNTISGTNIMPSGPPKQVSFKLDIQESSPGKTTIHFEMRYSARFLGPMVKMMVRSNMENIGKVLSSLGERIDKKPKLDYDWSFSPVEENQEQIKQLTNSWQDLMKDSPAPRQLAEYIYTAPAKYVCKIRPFDVAEYYGSSRVEMLRFCLLATRAGFLDLSWDVLCPSCKGPSQVSFLEKITTSAHCKFCEIEFNSEFDKNVEVTFRPTVKARKVEPLLFCASDPASLRHIQTQFNLTSQSEREIKLQLKPGEYSLRSLNLKGSVYIKVSPESSIKELSLDLDTQFPYIPDQSYSPDLTLKLKNLGQEWKTLKLHKLDYKENSATAAFVTTLQDFREFFSFEVLKPGIKLGISNMVILFSDLKGSTSMYEDHGDAMAFSLVQQHFNIMTQVIRDYNGGIVKTIGDAVMAVFSSPEDAVNTSFEILNAFDKWNEDKPENSKIVIKLGIHCGSCITLNLNDKLDYFGSTVNKAARIQGVSKGNDIIISEKIYSHPSVTGIIEGNESISVEKIEEKLRGIEGTQELYRFKRMVMQT